MKKVAYLLSFLLLSIFIMFGCASQVTEEKVTELVVEDVQEAASDTGMVQETQPTEEIKEEPIKEEPVIAQPEPVVDITRSLPPLPYCTEAKMEYCDFTVCDNPETDTVTAEQEGCYQDCLAKEKCRDVGESIGDLENVHKVTWAGHNFEVAQLRSPDYKSDGSVEWTSNGFIAHDYSMPRTKLLDVNMNQKIKVKVIANMEGRLDSDVSDCKPDRCKEFDYPFSEFALYFVDSKDSHEIKYGFALIGTEDNIAVGNVRDTFKADWFSVENAGDRIIFEDSSGRKIVGDENSPTEHKLSKLNQNDEWRLRINSHVNGVGYTKLEIKEIQVTT